MIDLMAMMDNVRLDAVSSCRFLWSFSPLGRYMISLLRFLPSFCLAKPFKAQQRSCSVISNIIQQDIIQLCS